MKFVNDRGIFIFSENPIKYQLIDISLPLQTTLVKEEVAC